MTKATAIMLARYSDWADQVLFKAIEGLPRGAAGMTTQTLFGSMIGTLNHNYQVDLIWRAHLLGEEHGFTSRRDLLHPELGALEVACQTLVDPEQSHSLLVYTAVPGSESYEKLRLLSVLARRSSV